MTAYTYMYIFPIVLHSVIARAVALVCREFYLCLKLRLSLINLHGTDIAEADLMRA